MEPESVADLSTMTVDQLEASLASARRMVPVNGIPAELILEELARRRDERRTVTMVRLTWAVTILTIINTAFVVLATAGAL